MNIKTDLFIGIFVFYILVSAATVGDFLTDILFNNSVYSKRQVFAAVGLIGVIIFSSMRINHLIKIRGNKDD